MGTKSAILKIHERKLSLHNMCASVDGISVKILGSKFMVIMEIMMKHRWVIFLGHSVYGVLLPSC